MLAANDVTSDELKEKMCKVMDALTRNGSNSLKHYMLETDFFTAPSSTMFHSAYPGGLAAHTWNVYQLLRAKVVEYGLSITLDSIVIAAFCHDLCKINYYEEDRDNATDAQIKYLRDLAKKEYFTMNPEHLTKGHVSNLIGYYIALKEGKTVTRPEYKITYKVKDQLPLGHGEKSLYIAAQHIELTDEEACAIRWHMIAFDAGVHFNYPSGYPFRQAMDQYQLVTLLFTADIEASNILEK
jgi:hypothetical protein